MSSFDPEQAKRLLDHAALPMAYSDDIKSGSSHEQAELKLRSKLGEGTELQIIKQGDSLAIISADPKTGRMTLSFDDTSGSSNAKFWGADHPLGGEVYSGLYGALMRDDSEGFFLDKVRDAVVGLSSKLPGKPELDMSGFSKRGSMAIGAAAQWISENFTETTGIKIRNIYTFGSPPFGDKDFSREFERHAGRLDINVWRVTGGRNDPVPGNLTDEGPWYTRPFYPVYRGSYYTHVGNQKDFPTVEGHSVEAYRKAIEDQGISKELNKGFSNPPPTMQPF